MDVLSEKVGRIQRRQQLVEALIDIESFVQFDPGGVCAYSAGMDADRIRAEINYLDEVEERERERARIRTTEPLQFHKW